MATIPSKNNLAKTRITERKLRRKYEEFAELSAKELVGKARFDAVAALTDTQLKKALSNIQEEESQLQTAIKDVYVLKNAQLEEAITQYTEKLSNLYWSSTQLSLKELLNPKSEIQKEYQNTLQLLVESIKQEKVLNQDDETKNKFRTPLLNYAKKIEYTFNQRAKNTNSLQKVGQKLVTSKFGEAFLEGASKSPFGALAASILKDLTKEKEEPKKTNRSFNVEEQRLRLEKSRKLRELSATPSEPETTISATTPAEPETPTSAASIETKSTEGNTAPQPTVSRTAGRTRAVDINSLSSDKIVSILNNHSSLLTTLTEYADLSVDTNKTGFKELGKILSAILEENKTATAQQAAQAEELALENGNASTSAFTANTVVSNALTPKLETTETDTKKSGGVLSTLGGFALKTLARKFIGNGAASNSLVTTATKAATAAEEAGGAVSTATQLALPLSEAAETGGAISKGAGIASKLGGAGRVLGKLGRTGRFLGGAGRVLGKVAVPLAATMAAYDAYKGFTADPNLSLSGKMWNATKSVASGATFGLSDYATGGVTTGQEMPTLPPSPAQFADLKMKKGDVIGGGLVKPGVLQFASKIQSSVPGFKFFSAFNDMYHQKRSQPSKHKAGQALDFTIAGGKAAAGAAAAAVAQIAKDTGVKGVYVQDEYNDPSGGATGGHIHVQFNDTNSLAELSDTSGQEEMPSPTTGMVPPDTGNRKPPMQGGRQTASVSPTTTGATTPTATQVNTPTNVPTATASAHDMMAEGRASVTKNINKPGEGAGSGNINVTTIRGGNTFAGGQGNQGAPAQAPIPAPIDREPSARRAVDGAWA